MEKPSFVCTTFIRSTPARVWQALTDPAFTERYWGVAFDSDRKLGPNRRPGRLPQCLLESTNHPVGVRRMLSIADVAVRAN